TMPATMHAGAVVDERFVIERFVRSGGMGAVYRALDRRTDQAVAFKILLGSPEPEDLVRFEREAVALSDVDHPGIVRYVAHGFTAEGQAYLAMEWIDGEDLEDRISRGPLSVDEVVTLGISIATALGAAHVRGVVHRDLKPSNILLEGDALDRAKIID